MSERTLLPGALLYCCVGTDTVTKGTTILLCLKGHGYQGHNDVCVPSWLAPSVERIKPQVAGASNLGVTILRCGCSLQEKMPIKLYIYELFRLVFGTLYPSYASYKAVRTKNVKEYVSKVSIFM
jgi:hypothetical protein